MAATTIALYSHDSVGLGHARRNRALAHALAERLPALVGGPVRGLLIAGHPDAGRDSLPDGWDWLILPGMTRDAEGAFAPRRLGTSAGRLQGLRAQVLASALGALDPDLFIVDRHPLGIDGELEGVLASLRERGCRTVLGLREVLDDPAAVRAEWDALGGEDRVARLLDAVWVYGDHRVYDPRSTGELGGHLARRATLTGYLAHGRPAVRADRTPVAPPSVLTVLGGGSDGARLARTAVAAEPPAGHRHLLVTGPQMPADQVEELVAAAGDRTEVRRTAADVPELIAEAAAVLCMGGYNTVAELLVTDTPALVVPRHGRRLEQPRRAHALAAVGAVETRAAEELAADDVTAWWRRAVRTRTDRRGIDLGGLDVVPHLAAALLGRPARARGALSSHAV